MNEGNPGEIDFGSSQFEVRVIGGRLYLYGLYKGVPPLGILGAYRHRNDPHHRNDPRHRNDPQSPPK